jgi:hypothetical protein
LLLSMAGMQLRLAVTYTDAEGQAQPTLYSRTTTLQPPTATDQGRLNLSESRTGNVGTDCMDRYTLSLTQGQRVLLTALAAGENDDPMLAVYDANGVAIAYADDNDADLTIPNWPGDYSAALLLEAPADGDYTVYVGGYDGDAVHYVLEAADAAASVAPSLDFSQATPITLPFDNGGQPLQPPADESDALLYRVSLKAGQWVESTFGSNGWEGYLLDANGRRIACAPADGDYYVALRCYDDTAATVALTLLDLTEDPDSLLSWGENAVAFPADGDAIRYFLAPQSGFFTLEIPDEIDDLYCVGFWGDGLTPLAQEETATGTRLTYLAPAAGYYGLSLEGPEGQTVAVTLTQLPVAAVRTAGPASASVNLGETVSFTVEMPETALIEGPQMHAGYFSLNALPATPSLAFRPVSWQWGDQSGPIAPDGTFSLSSAAAGAHDVIVTSQLQYLEAGQWLPVTNWPLAEWYAGVPVQQVSAAVASLTVSAPQPTPTAGPTVEPTAGPTAEPTVGPTVNPTASPAPTAAPHSATGDPFPVVPLILAVVAVLALAAVVWVLLRRRKTR